MSSTVVTVSYRSGYLITRGLTLPIRFAKWDKHFQGYVCDAIYHDKLIELLSSKGLSVRDESKDFLKIKPFRADLTLRDYQSAAYQNWLEAGKRGILVLPTGAGKTAVAVHAISELRVSALVTVPTIDLLGQWSKILESAGAEVSVLGGGAKEVGGLTVSTYDSAAISCSELGNRFELLVFDEVHHLPAAVYSTIAKSSLAPFRMGLTATYEREDGLHSILPFLVGPVVYSATHSELSGRYLSEYQTEVIHVSLNQQEKARYDECISKYRSILKKYKFKIRGPKDFQRLIILSGSNREIREALLARTEAQKMAYNSEGKSQVLRGLLERFKGEKIIIFTQFNELVNRISREFLIPSITHATPKDEREQVLRRFREGVYSCVVTSKVLDEGVDVPDASVGIILSGTGSKREYIQRLGRILRKRDGKVAKLVEVVSANTIEMRTSYRRK